MFIEESLYEFAKRGKHKKKNKIKPQFRSIDSTDDWVKPEDDDVEDFEDVEDIDVSDMTNAEELNIEEDAYDDELFLALKNDLKIPEFNRTTIRFRLKGDLKHILQGIPMARIGENTFLFKLKDEGMKKIALKDVILEQVKEKSNRAKNVSEYDLHDYLDDVSNSGYEEDDALEEAKERAKQISKEEHCVQHVNKVRLGKYEVEDWFDADKTVASYENGREL
jgi:hypothetical protein